MTNERPNKDLEEKVNWTGAFIGQAIGLTAGVLAMPHLQNEYLYLYTSAIVGGLGMSIGGVAGYYLENKIRGKLK